MNIVRGFASKRYTKYHPMQYLLVNLIYIFNKFEYIKILWTDTFDFFSVCVRVP